MTDPRVPLSDRATSAAFRALVGALRLLPYHRRVPAMGWITARLLAVGLLAASLLTAARSPRAAALLCAGAALLAGTLWVTAMIASATSTEGRILPAVYAFTATLIAASAAWRHLRRGA